MQSGKQQIEPKRKKLTLAHYQKGNPRFNLLVNERRLLIAALEKSNWKPRVAYKLNFPTQYITFEGYYSIVLKHHISIKNKNYKKLSEIN